MWDKDEIEQEKERDREIALLTEKCPGLDQDVIEDLIEFENDYSGVNDPWYVVVDRDGEYFLYGKPTKEALAKFLMEEIIMNEDAFGDKILGIFWRSKPVGWSLQLFIGD